MFNLTFFVVLSDKICKPSPYILCPSRHREEVWGETNISHFSSFRLKPSQCEGSRHQRSRGFLISQRFQVSFPGLRLREARLPNLRSGQTGWCTDRASSAGRSWLDWRSQSKYCASSVPPAPVSSLAARWSGVFVRM